MAGSKVNKRILRRMGYLADQEGIIQRYLREEGGWDSHLVRCRDFILKKVKNQSLNNITILGSGWLLDVPLEELSDIFHSITLIDIYHPRQVVKKAEELGNVKLISDDLTGGLVRQVWKKSRRGLSSLDSIDIPTYKFSFDPGLLISLNLLTQTDTLINDFVLKKGRYSIEEHRRFRERIQSAHLESLKDHAHLIISDFEEEIMDIDTNTVLKTNSLLFASIPESADKDEWLWVFDSSGEYYSRKRVVFKVMAIDNSKK